MTLPQTNAILTGVKAGAASEDWDTPAGAGGSVWTGSAQVYFQEKREWVTGQQADDVLSRILYVETSLRDWKRGEIVTFRVGSGEEQTGKVKMIERRELPGVGSLASTRLTLEDT